MIVQHVKKTHKLSPKKAIVPNTPPAGIRKSRRVRFKPGEKRFFMPMLTEKEINAGQINFMTFNNLGEFVPPIIQPPKRTWANVEILAGNTQKDRKSLAQFGRKSKDVGHNDSLELFDSIEDFDHDRINPATGE
jgi:hypothetical protein